MRIRPDDLVVGFPAKQIRKLLRQSVDSLSARHAKKILGINPEQAIQLLKSLERKGYLKRHPALPNSEQRWKRTVKGGALANALFSKPVSRQSAERTMRDFLDRVGKVNSNSYFLYRVQKAVVFGSFLSDAPFIGDLDIAVDLCPRENDPRKHSELIRARANEAVIVGRGFSNFVEAFQFAEQEVIMFLKSRSRILQLTRCDDGVLNIAESRVIFESPEKIPVAPMNSVPVRQVRRSRKPKGCPF